MCKILESRVPELIEKAISMALDGDAKMMAMCLDRALPALRTVNAPIEIPLVAGATVLESGHAAFITTNYRDMPRDRICRPGTCRISATEAPPWPWKAAAKPAKAEPFDMKERKIIHCYFDGADHVGWPNDDRYDEIAQQRQGIDRDCSGSARIAPLLGRCRSMTGNVGRGKISAGPGLFLL